MAGENDPVSYSVARPFCSCGEDAMLPLKLCFMCLEMVSQKLSAPNTPCGCLITQVKKCASLYASALHGCIRCWCACSCASLKDCEVEVTLQSALAML